ncbi:MAG: Sapep family Mn(2+)-dependent dipeptidase [Lachnospiraceae bacterium]|nr:Sapep family Mn(2+)-dependent dipeptidase [Lachnospiraceae bacterium]
MLDQIREYMDAHVEEMVADACALIAINSEKTEAKPGMPFGEGNAQVFEEAEKILTRCGFPVKNYENYVLTADLNDGPACLDILAHLDVVPAGEGWQITEPFAPVVKDGLLYGRGSAYDKGPAVAALYAMRAVKELGIPVKGNCRLILGGDEECGSSDIRYYYSKEAQAPMTFSPDAEFPLINIEKGSLHLRFSAEADDQMTTPALLEIQAGTKINVVPGKARARVKGIDVEDLKKIAEEITARTGVTFEFTPVEDSNTDEIAVLAIGAAAHAASPHMGNNALTALLTFLAEVPFGSDKVREILTQASRLYPHGDWNGKSLGVNHRDDISGELTLSLNLFSYDGKEFAGIFDCRAPICANDANTADVVRAKMTEAGFSVSAGKMNPPHYVPEESPFVQTLLDCYEAVTGKRGRPLAIGGGTYVHHIENGVAFGCGELDVDNRMHGADEFMSVEQMKNSAVIFAYAIAKLCQ